MIAHDPIPVYVPVAAGLKAVIDAGAAIVGSPTGDWLRSHPHYAQTSEEEGQPSLIIDYEGNRYGAVNMITFADRCVHAHGRHVEHYPTVARAMVPTANVEQVALYYPEHRRVEVPDEIGLLNLAKWLGLATVSGPHGETLSIDSAGLSRQLRGTGR